MDLREQRERDARIAREAVPEIVEAFQAGMDSLSASRGVAERYDLDLQKAYRWAQYVEERFERERRALARKGAALLWAGVVPVVLGVAGLVGRYYGVALPPWAAIVLLVVGAPVAAFGAYRGLTAKRHITVAADDVVGS
ncbi:MAG: hypothetical protein ACLFO1_09510 [Spirochaetaceae bacterium]